MLITIATSVNGQQRACLLSGARLSPKESETRGRYAKGVTTVKPPIERGFHVNSGTENCCSLEKKNGKKKNTRSEKAGFTKQLHGGTTYPAKLNVGNGVGLSAPR